MRDNLEKRLWMWTYEKYHQHLSVRKDESETLDLDKHKKYGSGVGTLLLLVQYWRSDIVIQWDNFQTKILDWFWLISRDLKNGEICDQTLGTEFF